MSTETMDVRMDCFVSGAIAFVLHAARFSGIAPLRFVKKKTGWRISPSTGWAIYGQIITTIISVILIGTVIAELQLDEEKTARMRGRPQSVVWIVHTIFLTVIVKTIAFLAPGQMRCIIACFNKMQKINHDLNIHHLSVSPERKKIALFILWMIISVGLPGLDHILLILKINLHNANRLVYWLHSLSFLLFWTQLLHGMMFILITLHIVYSFRAINDRLRTLLYVIAIADFQILPFIVPFDNLQFKVNKKYKRFINDKVDSLADSGQMISTSFRMTARPYHETVRRLAQAYVQACDVVRKVERCFGLGLLMMLVYYLFILVVSVYYFICNVADRKIAETNMTTYISLVLVQLFWCLYHFTNLVLINEPCHLTYTETEMTHQLLSHLMRCTQSIHEPLAGELELFFRQLILNKALYSPLKVTTLSRSLVVTIISSITTYLVIVFQL